MQAGIKMNVGVPVLKNKINRRSSLNLGGILCLVAAVYLICTILIRDAIAPISISSMLSSFNHWAKHWHVLAVGLLPIYVALMIFGTAIVGIYFGSAVHRWIVCFFKKRQNP
jgi:uncharacterized membrane protein YbhN (UPF0104 family)